MCLLYIHRFIKNHVCHCGECCDVPPRSPCKKKDLILLSMGSAVET